MKKILALSVTMFLLFVFGCRHNTTTVSTTHPNSATITKGADRLSSTQNNDGGWAWENPDPINLTGTSPLNTLGVTALGLLDAYKINGNAAYLADCIKTADVLHSLISSGGATFRLRGPDITFLVNLSVVTGDSKYANDAKTGYALTLTNYGPTAGAFSTYLFNPGYSRPYADWDINLYVQGLTAMNSYFPGQAYDLDAQIMTDAIYTNITTVYNLLDQTQSAYWLVISAAIDSFSTTETHAAETPNLLSILIAGQQVDGAFLDAGYGEDSQATAYAVMALLKSGETDAAKNGIAYLVDTQLANGGWTEDSGTVENTENSSEAIQALYAFN